MPLSSRYFPQEAAHVLQGGNLQVLVKCFQVCQDLATGAILQCVRRLHRTIVLNSKWVSHFIGINNYGFITDKLRELNRLCKWPQVTDI